MNIDWEKFLNLFTDADNHKKVFVSVAIFFLTTLSSLLIGRWWGKWRAAREWDNKHFMGRIIVSLNLFSDGFLKIRTVFERSLEEIFFSLTAIEKIQAAAKKTTLENPILPIPKEDRWFLLNFVLNAVAEEYNSNLVQYDAGGRLAEVPYILFLTCEAVGPDRIRKVRVMMMRKDLFVSLANDESQKWDEIKYEQPWHSVRLNTLRQASKLYQAEVASGEKSDNFITLEVYVPKS